MCPPVFDRYVPFLDVTSFTQASTEIGEILTRQFGRCKVKKPDHRYLRLLRAYRKRPRRRAAEQPDEQAPLHWPVPPMLSTKKIAHPGTAGDCRAAGFQSGL